MNTPQLDMSPGSANLDLPDYRHGDSVIASYFAIPSSSSKTLADLPDLSFIQERVGMFAASFQFLRLRSRWVVIATSESLRMQARAIAVAARRVVPPLSDAISAVLKGGAEAKVCWIAAPRVVARMHDDNRPFGKLFPRQRDTVVQFVGQAVCPVTLAMIAKHAITKTAYKSGPRPTIVSMANRYARPKLFWRTPVMTASCHD